MDAALDLFAGTGWGVACQALGVTETGIENMPEAVATRTFNDMHTSHDDVWTGDPSSLDHDGEIASPPCTTFSAAGKGQGREHLEHVIRLIKDGTYKDLGLLYETVTELGWDERTGLVLTPLTYWHHMQPRWLAFEQVPSVLPVWEAMAEVLRDAGYHTWTGILHSEQYGVPQTRTRAFLMAHHDREVQPPAPTHSLYHTRDKKRLDPDVLPWVSMASALGWDEEAVMTSNYGTGGDPRNRGVRTGSEPAPTVTSKIDRNKVSWPFERPSPTIVGTFRPDAGSVRVTVAEAALLQSYPPGFRFSGTEGKQYLQIGNAVPPRLAYHVLKELL